jgi:iron(III) transport system substrate-binding protein
MLKITSSCFAAARAAILAAIVGLLAPTHAWAIDPQIIEAAKKEGEVVWYTTLIVAQVVRPIVEAFEKKYPGVRVRYTRADNVGLVTKLLNEARANRPVADVVDGTAAELPLEKAGLIAQWVPDTAKLYPAEYRDANNRWVAPNLYFLTPAYNTNLIKKGEEPKTFEDLLDPKWKGKIVWNMGDGLTGGLGFMNVVLRSMGKEKGTAYLEKLSKQNIVSSDASSRAVLDQVISGEFAIALQIFHYHATISAEKGAPVDWIRMSPALSMLSTMSLMSNAPHPNAGKLLFDFVISEECQKIFQESGYLPALPSVPGLQPGLKPSKDTFSAIVFTQEDQANSYAELRAMFDKYFR